MRVLVCGSRDWSDREAIRFAFIKHLGPGAVVIHGAARGADSIAAEMATKMGLATEAYPAQWEKHGKAAGPLRNQRMLVEGKPDFVLAFRCNGASPGTDDMIRRAHKANVGVVIYKADHK